MNTIELTEESSVTDQTFENACLASCQKLVTQIERVKNNIVAEFRAAFTAHEQLLSRAISEADALAWQTAYPHLVFPTLAMEKVHAAAGWNARQHLIRQKNSVRAMSN
jgi:hypothetical protein